MFKIDFKYRQASTSRSKKWTEQLYLNYTDVPTASAKADALAALLRPLHGLESELRFYRLTDPQRVRAGTLRIPGGNAPALAAPTYTADYPATGLEIQIVGTDGTIVHQTFRGLKDDMIKGGDKVPDPQWDPLWTTFKAFVETPGNNVVIWVRNPANNSVIVTGISNAGQVTIPIADWSGVDRVALTGRGLPKYFRREWEFTLVNPTTMQLRGFKVQPDFVFTSDMKASITDATKHSVPIRTIDWVQSTNRRIGKEKN